jgi:two-component system cell cycle response regulator
MYNSKFRVLIVDDQVIIRNALKSLLLGIFEELEIIPDFLECSDGKEMVKLFIEQKENLHIIFTDECMPNLKGSEAVEIIRKIEKDNKIEYIPIISITSESLNTKEKIIKSGANYVISKPPLKSDLTKLLILIFSLGSS